MYLSTLMEPDVLKSALVYFLASLASFIEPINDNLGNVSYLMTTAVLFFNPARSVGSMIESILCSAIGLGIGHTITQLCLYIVDYYYKTEKNITEAHLIGIAALFITTFITAFIKAKLGNSRPSIKTATSLLHILLFVTITQLANEDALEYLPYKTTRIILALLGGTIISCLGCYLIYPYTASTKLKRSINATFPIIGLEIDILAEIILLKSTPQSIAYQVDHHQIAFQKLKIESNVLLSSIHEMKKESFFEFWTTLFMHRKAFNVIIVCIQRCFQFSNAVNTAAMMIEIDTKQERMIELAVHILEKCNNAVTMLSYDVDILSIQSLLVQEDISNAISEFNQYEDEIMSKLSKNTDILKITHFCLTVIEFSRQIIQLMQNMTELANEIALRRRIGRFQWFIQKIQHHRAHYSLSNITLFQINYAQSLSISCWKFFSRLQNFEVKFAFKTAITVTLMALPAFIEDFQDIYYAYRLNWAMTSALIVMTPSVGGTNLQGVWRLFGTWAGAGLAVFIWIVGHGNPFILAPSCFIIAVPAYALILKSDFKVLGRIILLSFSVILLSKYAVNADPVSGIVYTIYGLALRRGIAVSLGVLIGLFVSWYIWPFKARDALRFGLSRSLLDLSDFYHTICTSIESKGIPEALNNTLKERESKIYKDLIDLKEYAKQTQHEPRLKGKFPDHVYTLIIECCEVIFDALVLHKAIVLNTSFDAIQDQSPMHTMRERKRLELMGNVILLFYLLSGALLMKSSSVPEFVPDIFTIRKEAMESGLGLTRSIDYYFLYSVGSEEILGNLMTIHREMIGIEI